MILLLTYLGTKPFNLNTLILNQHEYNRFTRPVSNSPLEKTPYDIEKSPRFCNLHQTSPQHSQTVLSPLAMQNFTQAQVGNIA